MNMLFNDNEVFQKERPTGLSEQQKKDFLLLNAHEIIKNKWSDDNPEDIADDLISLIPFSANGFDLGKQIENLNCCYDVDIAFCEFLEDLYYSYSKEIDKNVKTWVKAHNIKPVFRKGDELMLKKNISGILANTIVYVTGMYEDTGIYLIHQDKNRNGGYLVAYEKLENSSILIDVNTL